MITGLCLSNLSACFLDFGIWIMFWYWLPGLSNCLNLTQHMFLTPSIHSDRMLHPLATDTAETTQLCDSLSVQSHASDDQNRHVIRLSKWKTAITHQEPTVIIAMLVFDWLENKGWKVCLLEPYDGETEPPNTFFFKSLLFHSLFLSCLQRT